MNLIDICAYRVIEFTRHRGLNKGPGQATSV